MKTKKRKSARVKVVNMKKARCGKKHCRGASSGDKRSKVAKLKRMAMNKPKKGWKFWQR